MTEPVSNTPENDLRSALIRQLTSDLNERIQGGEYSIFYLECPRCGGPSLMQPPSRMRRWRRAVRYAKQKFTGVRHHLL